MATRLSQDDVVTLTVRVPAELAEGARSKAKRRDETLSQVVRRALRVYVGSDPKEADADRSRDMGASDEA